MTRRSAAFCERLGIQLPIIQAPAGNISTPELAAAVSNAGGLGNAEGGRKWRTSSRS